MELYVEINQPDLVLQIPLEEWDMRKLRYLQDNMGDIAWEVREHGWDYAVAAAKVGHDPLDFKIKLDLVVYGLFSALASVKQADADAYEEEMREWERASDPMRGDPWVETGPDN